MASYVVMEIKAKTIVVLTPSGEFKEVKKPSKPVEKGDKINI